MAGKTQLTPFARLLLFLLVFLPLAYIGAAYYNGEDPLAKVKSWTGSDNNSSSTSSSSSSSQNNDTYDMQQELKVLRQENADLKKQIIIKDEEISRLKNGFSSEGSTRQKWGK